MAYDSLVDCGIHPVATRFELAAARLADGWRDAGRVEASAADLGLAAEFLRHAGFDVRPLPGCAVRLVHPDGCVEMLGRAHVMLLAFRCLVDKAVRFGAHAEAAWPPGFQPPPLAAGAEPAHVPPQLPPAPPAPAVPRAATSPRRAHTAAGAPLAVSLASPC
jgi:hypothetical protein